MGVVGYIGPPVGGGGGSTTSPATNRGPANGRIRAVRGYGPWLYAGLYTGSQSWLLAGQGQIGNMVWHTLQRFPHQAKISRIHVDAITAASSGTRIPNRIWAMMDYSIDTSGTSPTYFWPIPTLDGNPLAPSPAFSANYIGSARMDLGSVDWGAPSTPKVYRSVEVWADSLLSGYRYGDIYYDVDQSGSFSLLGRVQTSPKTTLYFSHDISNIPLVLNGGFETAGTGGADVFNNWDEIIVGGGGVIADETTVVRTGSHACKLTRNTASCRVEAHFTTIPDQDYTLSFWTRGDGTNQGRWGIYDVVNGSWFNNPGGSFSDTGVPGTTFTQVTITFRAPLKCTEVLISLSSSLTNGGIVYYDDVSLGLAYITGQSIELSLQSFTASPAMTPVYRAIVLRGALRPNSIDEITAVVRIGDEVRDRQGAAMRSGAVMLQELRDMAKSSSPVTLIDVSGAANYVSVLAPINEQETYQQGEENPEIAATIKLAVMVFS